MAALLEELAHSTALGDEIAALAAFVRRSVVVVRGRNSGGGSGVVWNDAGLVVTNFHVTPGERAEVEPRRGDVYPARVVASSSELDIAALQVDADLAARGAVPAVIGDSTKLRVGQLAMAVGNPLGERNAVSIGIVSSASDDRVEWRGGGQEAVRAAVTLRPGNSGGALADAQGRVIGIPNIAVGAGLGLAVPSHVVQRFLQASRGARAFFGIAGEWVRIPRPLRERFEIPGQAGLLLVEIAASSPAERAGLQIGDLLIGADTLALDDFVSRMALAAIDRPVKLAVVRGGALLWVSVAPTAMESSTGGWRAARAASRP